MQSLGALFQETVRRHPQKTAVHFKQAGRYVSQNWTEFSARVHSVASSFIERGIAAGDRVAILSENRPEWAVVDLAALTIGAVTVPIYPSLTSAEIAYILKDSGVKTLAVSSRTLFEKIIPIQNDLPELKSIIAFDASIEVSVKDMCILVAFLVSMESGKVLAFALDNLQQRGTLYVEPGQEIYEGQVVGNVTKGDDLYVNPTKGKQLTNMRASGSDDSVYLAAPWILSIERSMEVMSDDDYIEITPKAVRLRKKYLTQTARAKAMKKN
jgi:hypothetical protein